MRAITIWQPWAGFVAAGMKRIETRSWPTNHRGELAIHASVREMTDEEWERYHHLVQLVDGDLLNARGAVIAVATLTDCMRTQDLVCLDDRERLLGNYEPGRWAWRLESVVAFDAPIPCRGKQGLWTLDEQTEKLVRDELSIPF